LGNFQEAEYNLCKAICIEDPDFETFYLLALISEDKNDSKIASHYFQQALSIDNNNLFCLQWLGNHLITTNQFEQALSYLLKCVGQQEGEVENLNLIGVCYMNLVLKIFNLERYYKIIRLFPERLKYS
jgi:Tfp pilus assembly protein PilF